VAAADDQPRALPPRIVLYDGACALCTGSVAWLVARDRGGLLRFAPLQGPTAARLRARDARIPAGLDGVVLVEDGGVELRSRALLRAVRHLPPPWRWASSLGVLPAWLLDPPYRLVARLRHRLRRPGRACHLPAGDGRFLP
jgi:predicted DCC family thiol-disulfide oxidoreductase YuxK